MAYNVVPTVANGDSWSAAQHNTYIKDNFAAVWPYTTAGDMNYATASNALARLAISSVGGMLYSTGSAPAWLARPSVSSLLSHPGGASAPAWSALSSLNLHQGVIHKMVNDTQPAEFNTTSTTGADITGLTVNMVTTVTCTILLLIQGGIAVTGGAAIYHAAALGSIGGVVQSPDNVPQSYYAQYEPWFSFYHRTGVAAGTINCKAQLMVANSGRTAYFIGGAIYALAIME